MPAIITCPSCNATLKPKTPLPAGARVKCPKCQNAFVVPADDAGSPVGPAAGPKSVVPRPAAPKPKPAPAPPPDEEEEIAEAVAAGDEDDEEEAVEEGGPARKKRVGGGFKDRMKKVPMWGWIVSGAAVLFLMCGCCGVGILFVPGLAGGGGLLGPNITMNTYKQLKKGMSEDEVKKVMGGAPTTTSEIGGVHSDIWKGSGDDFITVQFSKGKALAAGYQITEGPAKMSGGGPLP